MMVAIGKVLVGNIWLMGAELWQLWAWGRAKWSCEDTRLEGSCLSLTSWPSGKGPDSRSTSRGRYSREQLSLPCAYRLSEQTESLGHSAAWGDVKQAKDLERNLWTGPWAQACVNFRCAGWQSPRAACLFQCGSLWSSLQWAKVSAEQPQGRGDVSVVV